MLWDFPSWTSLNLTQHFHLLWWAEESDPSNHRKLRRRCENSLKTIYETRSNLLWLISYCHCHLWERQKEFRRKMKKLTKISYCQPHLIFFSHSYSSLVRSSRSSCSRIFQYQGSWRWGLLLQFWDLASSILACIAFNKIIIKEQKKINEKVYLHDTTITVADWASYPLSCELYLHFAQVYERWPHQVKFKVCCLHAPNDMLASNFGVRQRQTFKHITK